MALLAVPGLASAGDLQVYCDPGVHLTLDGESAGSCTPTEDGRYFSNLAAGPHEIVAAKEGFSTQRFTVTVPEAGGRATVALDTFVPIMEMTRRGNPNQQTMPSNEGSVLLSCAPGDCTIAFGKQVADTQGQILEYRKVPVGTYRTVFRRPGEKPMARSITVERGDELHFRADFLQFMIIDVAEQERVRAQKRAAQRAEQLRLEAAQAERAELQKREAAKVEQARRDAAAAKKSTSTASQRRTGSGLGTWLLVTAGGAVLWGAGSANDSELVRNIGILTTIVGGAGTVTVLLSPSASDVSVRGVRQPVYGVQAHIRF